MTYSCSRNKVLGGPYSEKRGMICLNDRTRKLYIVRSRDRKQQSLHIADVR